MTQLSDHSAETVLSIEQTVDLIRSKVKAVTETETVALGDADGRVLAHDIAAPLPLPLFTNSAVDGYAVRAADLPSGAPAHFVVSARVPAGHGAPVAVPPGHAVRIFTGAPLPDGTDTVFMQEDVELAEDGRVILPAGLAPGANVRPAGEDVAEGTVVLKAGQRLQPRHIAVAAAFGLATLEVRQRVRVAVFSTGDELVSPGAARGPAQLFDSNRAMLIAMLRRLGCDAADLGIFSDQRAPLAASLRDAAAAYDLLLTTGGVSTGEEDHVKAAVESIGALMMWRMAIKPGRPVAMGLIDDTPFIGLPGNPVASFVTFVHVARPTVLALAGALPEPLTAIPVRAAFDYPKKAGRREYIRVTLRRAADGQLEAVKSAQDGAGSLASLIGSDGFAELGEDVTRVVPGQLIGYLPHAGLM